MSQQPILNIQMVPAGIDLVVEGLMAMPYNKVAVLIAEIRGQANAQLAQLAPPPAAPVVKKPRVVRTKKTKPQDLGTVGA
ncbi:hypothetical protein UFOVP715_34 [uncultured Caudovirales phage]|jgi:hypothetical protein|uniref:Uncharacterized protein n=1 Tax=uncultured Caudovirales phage TaxID=2100421 RepID=A0A6J5NR18_9CAUD|nr:hypothetical protein UFOVP715_34 [uncultured Caudovirales phage]